MVKGIQAGDVERHPASEEEKRGHTLNDKEVKIFGKIEESEMDTRILCVVAGGKLAFSFRKVKAGHGWFLPYLQS